MVLETEWESDFIRQGQRGLSEVTSYWIGGSSYTEQIGKIEYSEYSPSELGKFVLKFGGRIADR